MSSWDATIQWTGSLWTQPRVTAEVRAAIKATAKYALPLIQGDTPVRTGLMRRSWRISAGDRSLKITNSAPYAGFIEYGTTKITPRRPLGKNVDGIVQHFRNTLSESIISKIQDTGRGSTQLTALNRQPTRAVGVRQTLPRRI